MILSQSTFGWKCYAQCQNSVYSNRQVSNTKHLYIKSTENSIFARQNTYSTRYDDMWLLHDYCASLALCKIYSNITHYESHQTERITHSGQRVRDKEQKKKLKLKRILRRKISKHTFTPKSRELYCMHSDDKWKKPFGGRKKMGRKCKEREKGKKTHC